MYGNFRISIIIKMGKSCHQPSLIMHTVPASCGCRFGCMKIGSAICGVKIMEFMSRDLTKSGILFFRKSNISKSGQFRCTERSSRDHAADFAEISLHIFHFLMKIHKTAAFRQTGHSTFHGLPYRAAHLLVLLQGFSIQLRITATEKKPVQIPGKLCIMDRGKMYQFCSHLFQQT